MKYNKILFIFLSILLLSFLSNCGIKQVKPNEGKISIPDSNYLIYKSTSYDKYYRPILKEKTNRPNKIGDQYNIVFFKNELPIKSYQVLLDDINKYIDRYIIKILSKYYSYVSNFNFLIKTPERIVF